MLYECGCWYGPEDAIEPCCPIHSMPMKLDHSTDDDIGWAISELRRTGKLTEED